MILIASFLLPIALALVLWLLWWLMKTVFAFVFGMGGKGA